MQHYIYNVSKKDTRHYWL